MISRDLFSYGFFFTRGNVPVEDRFPSKSAALRQRLLLTGNSLINSNGGYYDPGVKLSPRAVADIIENFEDTRDTGFTMKGLAKLSKVSEPTAFKYVTVYEEGGVAGVVEYLGLSRAEYLHIVSLKNRQGRLKIMHMYVLF